MRNLLAGRTEVYRWIEGSSIAVFLLASLLLYVRFDLQPSQPLIVEQSEGVTAMASAMPNQGWAPLQVYLSAYGSESRHGPIVRYEWDLDGDGLYDTDATAAGGYAGYRYLAPGEYTVTLRVTDEQGWAATDQVTISVRHRASSNVDYWTVFDDSRVHRVDILLTNADWERIWADPEAKVTVPADAIILGERLNDVGFRMRGQFSLTASRAKKPWKIVTDAFVDGQEYHNLRQLIFTNNINDPTMLMEALSYELMTLAGVPASHLAFVELWIDVIDDSRPARFWGVYNMIERVDKKYIGNRFGHDAVGGNLYKASYAQWGPADLVYHGERIEDYPVQDGHYAYGKENNEEAADYSDIIALCRVVDGTAYETPEDYARALEQVLNVDGFLRYWAVIVATMNPDTYAVLGNNYYLFHNPATDRFEWLPWDLFWGGDPTFPLYTRPEAGTVSRAPLTDGIFRVERYRQRFRAYLDLLVRHFFNREWVGERARGYYEMIAPYVRQSTGDPMYYGAEALFSAHEFEDGWIRLADLAQARSEFIRRDLEQAERASVEAITDNGVGE